MSKSKARRIQLTEMVWAKVEAQAKELHTTESKVANYLLARVFTESVPPIPKGAVLP